MPRRNFTVDDVDQLIPSLERIFTDVVQLHASLRRYEDQLQGFGLPPTNAILRGEDMGGSPGVMHAKGMFKAYYDTLLEAVGRVADLGGEVKDLEMGLVDFPGRSGPDDICLCWRLGEKKVGHWHAADLGFSDRQPIAALPNGPALPLD